MKTLARIFADARQQYRRVNGFHSSRCYGFDDMMSDEQASEEDAANAVRAAVIEECAQVADLLSDSASDHEAGAALVIADRIRALNEANTQSQIEERSDEVSAASNSTSLTHIKRLVEKLSSVEKDTEYQLHHPHTVPWPEPRILDHDKRCECALCAAREWLSLHTGASND